jgi:hypothetical protein
MIGVTGYKLGITCCFCGGRLEIDEASRTTTCSHCSSILKVAREGTVLKFVVHDDSPEREVKFLVDRHLKENELPLVSRWDTLDKVYVPYWRVRGTVFQLEKRPTGITLSKPSQEGESDEPVPPTEVKILPKEVSLCGNTDLVWGIESLGVRTHTLRLQPLEEKFYTDYHFIPLSVSQEQAVERFDKSMQTVAQYSAKNRSQVQVISTGLESTLIYFPTWVGNIVTKQGKYVVQVDPVANRVCLFDAGEVEVPPDDTTPVRRAGDVTIIPHRCPNCGDDLPAGEYSVAYYCGNCRRQFMERGTGYDQVKLNVPPDLDAENLLFPFWVIKLSSVEWVEPDRLQKSMELMHFRTDRFYIPAFTISNPSKLLRLIVHYNREQNEFSFDEYPQGHYKFIDVTLSPEEATELVMPLIDAACTSRGFMPDYPLQPFKPKTVAAQLVWLPYALDRYFWREQITGATIEKAAVPV